MEAWKKTNRLLGLCERLFHVQEQWLPGDDKKRPVCEQIKYGVLIIELLKCWYVDFVTSTQNQANSSPLFPVLMLS